MTRTGSPTLDELEQRWARAQVRMVELEVDSLVVGPSPDMAYLAGFSGRQSERLLLFVLPSSGRPRLLVPRFEEPRFASLLKLIDASFWSDGEDPAELLKAVLFDGRRDRRIAIGSQLFARSALSIARSVPAADYVDGDLVLADLRQRKTAAELDLLRTAAEAADATVRDLFEEPLRGRSEAELAALIANLLIKHGHDAVSHTSVASGANAAVPHHQPTHHPIDSGPVVFDLGGTLGGYFSDITRTFDIGYSGPEFCAAYECVREANEAAFCEVRPGALASDVDAAARRVIQGAGYGPYFAHRTGHGIGLDVHEPPFLVAGSSTLLEPGMVFSIEPGIYLPDRFGVRIEDIVVVTEQGGERLNHIDHRLFVADG